MIGYALKRLALAVSLVWAVSFVAFVAFGLSFNPFYSLNLCGGSCKAQRDALAAEFHLHDPILDRYWLWFTGLFHHGFGNAAIVSYGGNTVRAIDPPLWRAAGITAQLMATSLVLTVLASVLLGVVAARRPGSGIDVVLRLLAYLTWSMPTFLTGVLLARWFAPTGWFIVPGIPGGGLLPWVRAMTLPAVTLSLGLIGLYSRYLRTALLSELQRPYAVVARSKGLTESRVTLRHALRNSLIPFVSVLSLDISAIVGASLAADYIFFRGGGLAGFFLNSLGRADPFILTAVVVVIAGVVAVFSLLTDLAVGWLDPRVRAGSGD